MQLLDTQSPPSTAGTLPSQQNDLTAVSLPLDDIDADAFVLRAGAAEEDGPDWPGLKNSLAERGQQHPIDVCDLGVSVVPRYGLICGYRRWQALTALYEETGEPRFETVQAYVRMGPAWGPMLKAMIEDNELRREVSLYQKGRAVVVAADEGLFGTLEKAVDELFIHAGRDLKYKVRAFAELYDGLDRHLKFPEAISACMGLRIAKALRTGRGPGLREGLRLAAEDTASRADERRALLSLLDSRTERRAVPTRPAAAWDGAGATKIEASSDGDTVTLQIRGLVGISPADLQRLVDMMGALVPKWSGAAEEA